MNKTALPSGRLTVMFTDIESSTTLWEADAAAMAAALAHHDQLLSTHVSADDGIVLKLTGDGIFAIFSSAIAAAQAALAIQRAIQQDPWPGDRLKVRIGLHHGQLEPTGQDYYGPVVNRAARVMDVANGDQIAVSAALAALLGDYDLRPKGEHQLRGIGTETISLLTAEDLVDDDRPMRSRISSVVKPLPAATHQTIGRTDEVRTVTELLGPSRPVSVTGPAGVGKTHFALDVARGSRSGFDGGAVLCKLAPVRDGDGVLQTIAEALGARRQPAMTLQESIGDYLQDRAMLIMLDSCEHVRDEVRQFAALVHELPSVALLTTSRIRLGLPGEQVFVIDALHPATDGVDLFVERARDHDSTYAPTADDQVAIQSICELVGGLPLGIELAAAWVRLLSVDQLWGQLASGHALLDGGDGKPSLRAAISWSYGNLTTAQADLFNRLSVFAGGFTLEAVVAVCTDPDHEPNVAMTLEHLRDLLDKSMIQRVQNANEVRFRMLEPLRQRGIEQLAEQPDGPETIERLVRRHATHYVDFASDVADKLLSEKEAEAWDQLDTEWPNIRQAWQSLMADNSLDTAVTLVTRLGWFATLSMRFELLEWALELSRTPQFASRADATGVLGLVAFYEYLTVNERSEATAARGLELDPTDPFGYCRTASTAVALNNMLSAEESDRRTADWIGNLDEHTEPMARLWALGMRVFHICSNAPSIEAAEHLTAMQRIADETGSATALAIARWAGGMLSSFESVDAGLADWRQGLDAASSLSDVHLLMHLIWGLELHFAATHGDLDEVIPRTLEVLQRAHDQHYVAGTSHLFGVAAIVLARAGRAETGASLLGSMMANGHVPRPNARSAVDRALDGAAPAAIDAGRRLSIARAARLAIDELGHANQGLPYSPSDR